MRILVRALIGQVVAGMILALTPLAPATGMQAPVRPDLPVRSSDVDPAHHVRSYWTKGRMRSAVPLTPLVAAADAPALARSPSSAPRGEPGYVPPTAPTVTPLGAGSSGQGGSTVEAAEAGPYPYTRWEVPDPSVAAYRTHGKVFFSYGGGQYVCSGTALTSANESVVWTAGHCVHGGGPGETWVSNWMFVPARKSGSGPFGSWAADSLLSTSGWVQSANLRYDMGAAVTRTNSGGQSLTDVVGGRGIAWNLTREQTFSAIGYPAAAPFTGERMWVCDAPYAVAESSLPGPGPDPMGIGCDMTGGSSGGGWVIGGDAVNSNVSFGIVGLDEVLFGPYFGTAAQQLYESAQAVGLPPPPSPTPTPTPTPTPSPTPSPTPEPPPGGEPEPSPSPTPEPTPVPGAFRPDAAIKLRGEAAFRGDGVYNATGQGQTRKARIRRGSMATFVLLVGNDGDQVDAFSIDACPTSRGFRVRATSGSSRAPIGSGQVDPGGAVTMRLTISAGAATPTNSYSCQVTARSAGDDAVVDVARAVVRVRG